MNWDPYLKDIKCRNVAQHSHFTATKTILLRKWFVLSNKNIAQNISFTFNICRLLTGLRSWEWKEDWNSFWPRSPRQWGDWGRNIVFCVKQCLVLQMKYWWLDKMFMGGEWWNSNMQMILDIQIPVTIEPSQTAQLSYMASRGLKYLITGDRGTQPVFAGGLWSQLHQSFLLHGPGASAEVCIAVDWISEIGQGVLWLLRCRDRTVWPGDTQCCWPPGDPPGPWPRASWTAGTWSPPPSPPWWASPPAPSPLSSLSRAKTPQLVWPLWTGMFWVSYLFPPHWPAPLPNRHWGDQGSGLGLHRSHGHANIQGHNSQLFPRLGETCFPCLYNIARVSSWDKKARFI